MDVVLVALVLAGSLHTHQQDRPDIAVLVVLDTQRVGLKFVEFLFGRSQSVLPVGTTFIDHVDRQLDHLFVFQVSTRDIHQYIADMLAGIGRRRQLQNESRVVTTNRVQSRLGISLVPFVNHHDRANQAQYIAQALLRIAHLIRAGQFDLVQQVGPIQVRNSIEQGFIAQGIVDLRKKGGIATAVLKHFARFFRFPPYRTRLQHHQHHT